MKERGHNFEKRNLENEVGEECDENWGKREKKIGRDVKKVYSKKHSTMARRRKKEKMTRLRPGGNAKGEKRGRKRR